MEELTVNPYAEGTLHEYILTHNKKGLRIRLEVNDKDHEIIFSDGRLQLADQDVAQEFDKFINNKMHLRVQVTKVNRAAALEFVKQHHQASALKGGFHSDAVTQMRREALLASKLAEQEAAPNNPEALEELKSAAEVPDMIETEIQRDVLQSPAGLKLRK